MQPAASRGIDPGRRGCWRAATRRARHRSGPGCRTGRGRGCSGGCWTLMVSRKGVDGGVRAILAADGLNVAGAGHVDVSLTMVACRLISDPNRLANRRTTDLLRGMPAFGISEQ